MKLQVASLLFGLSSLVLAKGNKAFLNGADISSLKILENQGITYSSGGNVTAFENILSNHGHNLARIRVWTAGDYDTKYAIALAKRVKKAGMKLLIDLHYSDTCMPLLPFWIYENTKNMCFRGGSIQTVHTKWMANRP